MTELVKVENIPELITSMTSKEIRLAVALMDEDVIAEGCRKIGVNPQTVYNHWDLDRVKELRDRMRVEAVEVALAMRHQNLNKAMATKVKLLESLDEAVRGKAATEIIEWELGKAVQRRDVRAVVHIPELKELIEKVYK